MIRATRVLAAGSWSGDAADTVVLDHDHRHRRRLAMRGEAGLDFLLDLAEAASLRDGDGLVLEDGRIVAVKAATEWLTEVTAPETDRLTRIAWHLGNRHLPVQFVSGRLLIRRDHVIEAMLAGLGARIAHVEAPFDPESGAYAHGDSHRHGHDHA